jgi:hypothetical protein
MVDALPRAVPVKTLVKLRLEGLAEVIDRSPDERRLSREEKASPCPLDQAGSMGGEPLPQGHRRRQRAPVADRPQRADPLDQPLSPRRGLPGPGVAPQLR